MFETIFGWETPWGKRKRRRAEAQAKRNAEIEQAAKATHEAWKTFEAARRDYREREAQKLHNAVASLEKARLAVYRKNALDEMRAARKPVPAMPRSLSRLRSESQPTIQPSQDYPQPAWPSLPSREWDGLIPGIFERSAPVVEDKPEPVKAGGGSFDGGGASGDWSRSDDSASSSASSSSDTSTTCSVD